MNILKSIKTKPSYFKYEFNKSHKNESTDTVRNGPANNILLKLITLFVLHISDTTHEPLHNLGTTTTVSHVS